jgi:hypothetical protein
MEEGVFLQLKGGRRKRRSKGNSIIRNAMQF